MQISLSDIAKTDNLIGSEQGRDVHHALYNLICATPLDRIVAIVPGSVQRMDATFAREAIVTLVKRLQGSRLVYLKDFWNRDFLDNCGYAARALDAHLMHVSGGELDVLGATFSKSWGSLLASVFSLGVTTTSVVAGSLGISVQNASVQMKKMADGGLMIRREEDAFSGGREWHYQTAPR